MMDVTNDDVLARLLADAQRLLDDISLPRNEHDVISSMADVILTLRKRVEAANRLLDASDDLSDEFFDNANDVEVKMFYVAAEAYRATATSDDKEGA